MQAFSFVGRKTVTQEWGVSCLRTPTSLSQGRAQVNRNPGRTEEGKEGRKGKGKRERARQKEGGRRWDTVIRCEPSRQPGERRT